MTIGILGGGQLGRMLVQAASPLDIKIVVLDKSSDYPAPDIWPYFVKGDFTNYDDVLTFGRTVDIITVEIESVNTEALAKLEREGKKVYPQAQILNLIADKGLQKDFYKTHHLPTSAYINCDFSDIPNLLVSGEIKFPFVQKLRKGGYDGKGVLVVKNEAQLAELLPGPSMVEHMVDIDKEIAVIVCRNPKGEIAVYPAVEMQFHPTANLVEYLFCPSSLTQNQNEHAQQIAKTIAEKMQIIGLLAVELFLDKSGEILINEVAPRPHNSGHHTIEACVTSQYEQHLRALLDWPLGDTTLLQPAVMLNVLGEPGHDGDTHYQGLADILKVSGVFPHLYGKKQTKPFRKMGHITITAPTLAEAKSKAMEVRDMLKVVSK